MEARTRARWEVLGAAALFSTGGAAIKATELTGWQVAAGRSAVAALALLLLVPSARRAISSRTWLVGLAYAATLSLFVLANKHTTAANAIFLQATAPLFLLLLAPWLLGERVRARDLRYMAALAVGFTLFFLGLEPAQATAPDPALGNVLAAASALTWALTLVGLRWLGRAEALEGGAPPGTAAAATLCGNLIVVVALLPLALPVEAVRTSDLLWLGWLGVFQIALAYVLFTRGVRRVGALESGLLLLLEPVMNTGWTWLVHGETPALRSLLGGAVVVGASAVHVLAARRREPPQ